MNRLEQTLIKWKFKKIAVIYVIISILIMIALFLVTARIFKERITFALQYEKLENTVESGNVSDLGQKVDQLAATSSDIVDILVLDDQNKVIYSAKQSPLNVKELNLKVIPDTDRRFLADDVLKDVVFRIVDEDELMIQPALSMDFGEYKHDYDNARFYERSFSGKTVYMLSHIEGHRSAQKVYVIAIPTEVPGGLMILKIEAIVVVFLFMIYWVLVALWIVQNAAKSGLHPVLWGLIALLTNLAGVVVYFLYKAGMVTCPSCHRAQARNHLYCTECGQKLASVCSRCGAKLTENALYCPHCGQGCHSEHTHPDDQIRTENSDEGKQKE